MSIVGGELWPLQKLLSLYEADGQKPAITSTCTKARKVTKTDDERFAVLDQCLAAMHAANVDQGLAWAPKGDVAFFSPS